MAEKLKLTPTFTDTTKDAGYKPPLKITPSHEPLASELARVVKPEETAAKAAEPGQVSLAQPLKVACIGTAPSSRLLAPFADPTWQIWACSAGNMNSLPRVDAWFEIHGNLLWPECASFGPPYIEWLKQQKFPVYMQDQSLVPNAISLPIKELVQEFSPYFFTSSFAYMIAMAIKKGAKEIALFGIDMASREEYIIQRPGAYHFFLEASRRGIKIWAPNESDIMQPPPLYGFADSTPMGRKIMARRKELSDRLGPMKQQLDGLQRNIVYLEGALEDVDYWQSIWSGVDKPKFTL